MSKKRLEKIKYYYREMETLDPGTQSDINWLIEQAERVKMWEEKAQQLHESLKRQDGTVDKLRVQNKRYREMLEEIARGRFPGASYKARKALEE